MALNLLAAAASRQPKSLVEFRAGKMNLTGNMVHPDKRKGLVYVYLADDNLIHFCWKDRKTGTIEDDLIVFPDDCEYKKVTQAKEGSRVFMLKFKVSARKLFFWMQEPKVESDDEYVVRVNDALNNPVSNARGTGTSGSDADMHNLLSGMSQSQLMQFLGGMTDIGNPQGLLAHLAPSLSTLGATASGNSGSSTTIETSSSSAGNGGPPKTQSLLKVRKHPTPIPTTNQKPNSASSANPQIQLEDLQSILSRIQTNARSIQVDLAAGVNSESINRITSCPKTIKKLAPFLPQFGGPETSDMTSDDQQKDVEDTLKSPQFQSALSSFCSAINSGELGPLISQFGMGEEAVTAAQNGNLEAFINAIQKEANEGTETEHVEQMNMD